MLEVGMIVFVASLGITGVITAIRRGMRTTDILMNCSATDGAELPDYVEIDGNIQVHPSRVTRVKEN